MKVFLIGGNGFLGSATALEYKDYLQLTDDEIRVFCAGCEGFIFASGVDERIDGPPPIYDFFNKYTKFADIQSVVSGCA